MTIKSIFAKNDYGRLGRWGGFSRGGGGFDNPHGEVIVPWASNIIIDLEDGDVFEILLTHTTVTNIDEPINAYAGQKFMFRFLQNGAGSNLVSWDAKFNWSLTFPQPVLSTSPYYWDYVGFVYNYPNDSYDIIGTDLGHS